MDKEKFSPTISSQTKFFIVLTQLFFIFFVVKKSQEESFFTRFTLPWILLGVFNIFFVIFPKIIFRISEYLGFRLPVNFFFFLTNLFLTWRVYSLSVKISRLEHNYKREIQQESLSKVVTEMDKEKR